jgi:hypothetical protein
MTIRDLKVSPMQFCNETVGYRVTCISRDCSDSLWDTVYHRAVFRTSDCAEKFLKEEFPSPTWSWHDWSHSHIEGAFSVLDRRAA